MPEPAANRLTDSLTGTGALSMYILIILFSLDLCCLFLAIDFLLLLLYNNSIRSRISCQGIFFLTSIRILGYCVTQFPGGLNRCGQILANPALAGRFSLHFPALRAFCGNDVNLIVQLPWTLVYLFVVPGMLYESIPGTSFSCSKLSRSLHPPKRQQIPSMYPYAYARDQSPWPVY